MRTLLILLLGILGTLSANLGAAEPEGKVVKFGIFKPVSTPRNFQTPQAPSGVTRVSSVTPTLVVSTNRIPARPGLMFGFDYEVANVPDGNIEITKKIKHPTMTKPDGSTTTGFIAAGKGVAKGARFVGWTGYGFDHPYEMEAGTWEFELSVKGKVVCKQEFIVFKE